MSRFKLSLAALVMPLLVAACDRGPAGDALDEVQMVYIQAEIFDPVACDQAEVDGEHFVFCRAVGGQSGGLFLADVEASATDRFVLRPVNGKARQHLGAAGIAMDCMTDEQPKVVPAKLKAGVVVFACSEKQYDIPAVLAAF